jgi:large subunit ribosomal protein L32
MIGLMVEEITKIEYNTEMPQEPKKRHSRARKGKRRASIKLQSPSYKTCKNCGKLTYPHTACKKCGFYSGKQAVAIRAKKKKEESA